MLHRLFVLLAAGALCLGIASPRAEAASFTFTKIADTNTAIPGGFSNFVFFGIPVLDGGTVVFNGSGTCCPFQTGIYAGDGSSLQKLANALTPIPGGTGNFGFFGDVAASGGMVAFVGENGLSSGVYSLAGGSLTKVADTSTPIPGGVGNFQSFGLPLTVDSGRVAFVGVGSSLQRGVYSFTGGSLTLVADTNTAMPDGPSNFGGFAGPSASGVNLAFSGFNSAFEGIYTIIGGVLANAVDTNTPMPGGSGNFVGFASPALEGSTVAFIGLDASTPAGVYVVGPGGALTVIADITMPAPGGTGNFTFFGGDPSISGGNVSFGALDAANQGAVYRAQGGVLTRIVGAGDLLDGKVVSGIGFKRGASNGNSFAFYATFPDGSQGIFLATEASPPADIFLHKSGSSLVLNGTAPTAATPASQDSAALKFSGGNPWKAVGTWSAPAAFTAGTLDSLSPVHAWLGLKTTDDNGTRFDVRAEVLKNGAVVGSGEVLCITGVVRDPALALEVSVPLGSFTPTPFNGTTDVLALRVLARIGTNGSGAACGGHGSASALRLYFDAVSRPSRLGVLLD